MRPGRSRTDLEDDYSPQGGDLIGKVSEAKGRHRFTVEMDTDVFVEAGLPNRFRKAVWIRRGSFVVLRSESPSTYSIEHILTRVDIKTLKKTGRWPLQFTVEGPSHSDSISSNSESEGDYENDE